MDSRSLVLIGTPVLHDVLDEATGVSHKKERAEFVPAWKQTVTDSEGRKRFHGAFTGGFSAGYFNTVGSKEGWTPSSFVSTRDARGTAKLSVDDFMDDEDREMGLANTVGAKSAYALFAETPAAGGSGKAPHASVERAMDAMLAPAPETVGLMLMRKMGWVDGQGIGPMRRSSSRSRSADSNNNSSNNNKAARFGPALSRDEIEEIRSTPVAPRDVGVVKYANKDDARGLGYNPLTLQPLETAVGPSSKKKSKDAFGLGALEEEEAEEDVYGNDEGRYESAILVGGRKRDRDQNEAEEDEGVHHSARRCSDGRPPIKGFVLASSSSATLSPLPQFPTIQVPSAWKPNGAPAMSPLGAAPSPAVVQWAISAAQRGLAMMEAAKKKKSAPVNVPITVAPPPAAAAPRKVAGLPFQGNPAKQQRYQNWLLAENGLSSVWKDAEQPSLEEMLEFAKVKSAWSAVPEGMSDRFAAAGTTIIADESAAVKLEAVAQEFRKYGPGTTHSEVDWAPEPLLCKRWNIKDPFADSSRPRPNSAVATERLEAFPSLTRELEKQFGAAYRVQMELAAEEARKAVEAQRLAQEKDANAVMDAPRPAQEVFRAIFDTPVIMIAPEAADASASLPPVPPQAAASVLRALSPAKSSSSSLGPPNLFQSIFGDFPPSAQPSSLEPEAKKSRAQELLEKTVVLSDWVESERRKDKKDKKDKKKKDKKKKDKKRKDKKKEKKTTTTTKDKHKQ